VLLTQLFICTTQTSVAQREQVFKKSKEQIKQIAVDGAVLLKELADETEGKLLFPIQSGKFSGNGSGLCR